MREVLAAVPARQSISPKSRLASVLSAGTRRRLSLHMAGRVLAVVEEVGARPLVLAADRVVMDWAEQRGWEAIEDREPSLNAAAAGAVEMAAQLHMSWIVVHADLPLLSPMDIAAAMGALRSGGWVLAPSSDGGTSLIGGPGGAGLDFAYGKASFHRHLSLLRHHCPQVVHRLGFALDLDRPSDLQAALSHPRGAWLASFISETEMKRLEETERNRFGTPSSPRLRSG
ncbi:MAG: 2-phospho-L-lactate guanylyltransferase [Actinomycetia bacterium]|nr:2-phospho-L-lactate guanylyltransferase [Actinomycetes bacterium]